jgi:predicted CxxxxCH...CXXCH cytochrome family protein
MKKLQLDLDQVQVVSFSVETKRGGKGTVNGFSYNTSNGYTAMWGEACGSGESCNSCHPHICAPMPDLVGQELLTYSPAPVE